MTFLRAALAFAQNGRAVFPCAPGEKVPAIPKSEGGRGFLEATTDARTIWAWWSRWPNANVGMACEASGLLVVDVDVREDRDGTDTLAELERVHGRLPETRISLTPNGGIHYFYSLEGVTADRWRGSLGPGIDLKVNGYVLLPPSKLATGGNYRWANHLPVVPVAPWVLGLAIEPPAPARPSAPTFPTVRSTPWAEAALARIRSEVSSTAKGSRNQTLNRAAHRCGLLVGGGLLSRARVVAELTVAALEAGLPEKEISLVLREGGALEVGAKNPIYGPSTERPPRHEGDVRA